VCKPPKLSMTSSGVADHLGSELSTTDIGRTVDSEITRTGLLTG
jgi:hypothetical protein